MVSTRRKPTSPGWQEAGTSRRTIQISGVAGAVLLLVILFVLYWLASSILSITLGQVLIGAAIFAGGYVLGRSHG